jgi:hypothetical protein
MSKKIDGIPLTRVRFAHNTEVSEPMPPAHSLQLFGKPMYGDPDSLFEFDSPILFTPPTFELSVNGTFDHSIFERENFSPNRARMVMTIQGWRRRWMLRPGTARHPQRPIKRGRVVGWTGDVEVSAGEEKE